MKKALSVSLLLVALQWAQIIQPHGILNPMSFVISEASAEQSKPEIKSWSQLVDVIEKMLAEAHQTYQKGDSSKAKELINESYFGAFEADGKGGMESAIRGNVSARTAQEVEAMFKNVRLAVVKGKTADEMRKEADLLVKELRKYAAKLEKDGVPYSENPFK